MTVDESPDLSANRDHTQPHPEFPGSRSTDDRTKGKPRALRNDRVTQILNTIFTGVIAITAVCGTYFVIREFKQLKSQNEILNRSLKQSYRPVGSIRNPRGKIAFITKTSGDNKETWDLVYSPFLSNLGHGILIYLGYVYAVAQESIDFRHKLLSGITDTLAFDSLSGYARGAPMAPGDSLKLNLHWEQLPFSKRFFLYTLVFYKNQDGDVFDTEHLISAIVHDTSRVESTRAPIAGKEPGVRDSYHWYTEEERIALRKRFQVLRHPLAEHF